MSYPSTTANVQVTIKSLAANSLEYLVPLTAAVDIYWLPWMGTNIKHLGGSVYRQDQELGIDWVPDLKETSLVCPSASVQEGLST